MVVHCRVNQLGDGSRTRGIDIVCLAPCRVLVLNLRRPLPCILGRQISHYIQTQMSRRDATECFDILFVMFSIPNNVPVDIRRQMSKSFRYFGIGLNLGVILGQGLLVFSLRLRRNEQWEMVCVSE